MKLSSPSPTKDSSTFSAPCRILPLPIFPVVSDADATNGAANDAANDAASSPFSPNALLDGFVAGPENRQAELAVRLAFDGVPIFSRPIGGADASPLRDASNPPAPSRADVEFLFRDADEQTDRFDATFPLDELDAASRPKTSPFPPIVGRTPLEEANFLTPLVFYGPNGSGKTRLVEGICQRRRLREPNKMLYYLSGADFFQALVNAIRNDQTPTFRRLFSQAGVVAIENADVLAEREAAQLEFLPILDAAAKARKLVILTFSKLPNEIPGFFPELAARLSAGLLVPVRLPSRPTKRSIVERVSAKIGLKLSEESVDFCVDALPTSVGGICATLVQGAREFSTSGTPPTPENLASFLERRNPPPDWSLDKIVKTVAKYFSVSVVEMRSEKRSKTIVLARKFVAYLARKLTSATLQEIGRQFSNREHSTILHAARELEEKLDRDPTLRRNLRDLVEILRAQDYFNDRRIFTSKTN